VSGIGDPATAAEAASILPALPDAERAGADRLLRRLSGGNDADRAAVVAALAAACNLERLCETPKQSAKKIADDATALAAKAREIADPYVRARAAVGRAPRRRRRRPRNDGTSGSPRSLPGRGRSPPRRRLRLPPRGCPPLRRARRLGDAAQRSRFAPRDARSRSRQGAPGSSRRVRAAIFVWVFRPTRPETTTGLSSR
jgi:hypothetical protein